MAAHRLSWYADQLLVVGRGVFGVTSDRDSPCGQPKAADATDGALYLNSDSDIESVATCAFCRLCAWNCGISMKRGENWLS